jgi:hypothetical protein
MAAFCGAVSAHALDVGGVAIHGSLSTTATYTDNYNVYGHTDDKLGINAIEAIVNGTYQFDNGLRAGAQVYAYHVTDFEAVVLDWASLDYRFNSTFGVRVGRNKRPFGLYNDSQDLDQVRTFASLPLAFYPRYLRTITSSTDGVNVYGDIPAGKAGSFEYQAYAGRQDDIKQDSLLIRGISNANATYSEWGVEGLLWGTWLSWNTPVEGLRFVASYNELPKNTVTGVFPGTPFSSNLEDVTVRFSAISAEYARGKWVFAAEARRLDIDGDVVIAPPINVNIKGDIFNLFYYYGMVTYQATDRLGLGVYYSFVDNDPKDTSADARRFETAHDYSVAASYALTDWWLVKLEYHRIVGTALLIEGGYGNVTGPGRPSSYDQVVLKTTLSF